MSATAVDRRIKQIEAGTEIINTNEKLIVPFLQVKHHPHETDTGNRFSIFTKQDGKPSSYFRFSESIIDVNRAHSLRTNFWYDMLSKVNNELKNELES